MNHKRVIAAALFSLVAAAPGADAQEVTLKGITSFAEKTFYSRGFEKFIDKVNADGKGVIQINYIGGPKAMPPFEVGNALKNGVVDIANVTGAFYTNLMPEADAWKLTERPMAELRKNGGYDYMARLYEQKLNAILLARHVDNNPFHIYLTKPISKLDLTGLKLRITPVYRDFFQALGATVVQTRARRGLHGARARRRRRLRLADHRHLRPRLAREDQVPRRSRLLQRRGQHPHQQGDLGQADRGAEEGDQRHRRVARGPGARDRQGERGRHRQAEGGRHRGHRLHRRRRRGAARQGLRGRLGRRHQAEPRARAKLKELFAKPK